METPSVPELVDGATGNIEEKHLTTDSGMVFTYLYDGPLIEHLLPGEQPHYIFSHNNKGYRIEDQHGDRTPHHTGSEGKRYLIITDQRILYVAGCRDGDESIEHSYDEIYKFSATDSDNLEFLTTDKEVYTFAPVGAASQFISEAVDYVEQRLADDGADPDSFEADTTQGDETVDASHRRVAEKLAANTPIEAVTPELLTQSGPGFTNSPIVEHLESGESIAFVLDDTEDMTTGSVYNNANSSGVGIDDKENTTTARESSPVLYVVTSRRVLCIIPQEDEDDLLSIPYDSITEVEDLHVASFGNRSRVAIHTEGGTTYHLWLSKKQQSIQQSFIEFLRDATGTEPDQPMDDTTDSSANTDRTEPAFTTRGKEVRLAGNTQEKTNCGRVEIYSDKISIQQKGALMSKGWVTVSFDDIVDVQMSSLGKLRLMTNRQDVAVTGLGGPTGTKILEHIRDYLEQQKEQAQQRQAELDQQTRSPQSAADEIAKFAKLKEQGILSEEEFQQKKDELL